MGCGLERNGERRVDQPAVEDHDLLGEASLAVVEHDVVVVAAGGEQRCFAVLHDPGNDEARLRPRGAALAGRDKRHPDHVTVALRFVDVGLAQRTHAVAQHGARGRIDHAERQAALEILRRGNAVAALLGEEIRPRFELVVVDRLGVAGVEVFDRELELDVHVNLDHPPPTAPRAARAFPQRMQAWAFGQELTDVEPTVAIHSSRTSGGAGAGQWRVGWGSPNLSRGRACRPKTGEAKCEHYLLLPLSPWEWVRWAH